jgi:uncharacterized membrane protein
VATLLEARPWAPATGRPGAEADDAGDVGSPGAQEQGTGQPVPARIGWSAASLVVVFAGLQVWPASLLVPGAPVVAMALIGAGLLVLWRCWSTPAGPSRAEQLIVLGALGAGLACQAALAFVTQPFYGTDSVAFGQYAADLLLHGRNPYPASMAPALEQFQVPVIFNTYLLDGTRVDAVSYPAGSFLLYVPALLLGLQAQAAIVVDVAFWIGSTVLLWRLLPAELRWVSAILAGASTYVNYLLGGVTDSLYLPFVLLAVWRWDRYRDGEERSWARWIGPVALGMAMAVKQTPWLLLPFLVLGVAFEAQARAGSGVRTGGRYLAIALGVFTAINAPFIVWDAGAWWERGMLTPLTEPMIPGGQGLVNLTLASGFGGGRLSLYSLAAGACLALALAALCLRYTALKRAWLPLATCSFFLAPRSFGSYLIMLVPAALLAAVTVRPSRVEPFAGLVRIRRPVLGTLLGATLLFAGLALVAPAPLDLDIVDMRATGQLQSISELTVRVHNRTGRELEPSFTVNANGTATTFWYARGRTGTTSVSVPAHATRDVTLQAPNTASMPGLSDGFVVEAFTDEPATVSTSVRQRLNPVSVRLTPREVEGPVPLGEALVLTAQLQDRVGNPVRRAGEEVHLGQIVYAERTLLPGLAAINGRAEGASPVAAVTDEEGRARFRVVGVEAQRDPVYFQAWIEPPGSGPAGYSEQLSVRFLNPDRRTR